MIEISLNNFNNNNNSNNNEDDQNVNNNNNSFNNEIESFINNLKEDWEDIKSIGKGSYGIIVKARKKNGILNGIELGNNYCAIKRIKKDPRVKLDNECEILQKIKSIKNDQQLFLQYYHHEIKKEDQIEYIYIYTEYLCGFRTICNLVKEKKRIEGDENIIYIAWRILVALDILSDNLIMHRDISPNNIMVSKDLKQVKLIDFGKSLSLSASSNSVVGGIVGTAGFIAPEMVKENNHPGRKSDIWSLGALVIFMYGYFIPNDINFILEIPSDLPINIKQFLKIALKKRYNTRSTANELLNNQLFLNYQQNQVSLKELEFNENNQILDQDLDIVDNNQNNNNNSYSSSSSSSSSPYSLSSSKDYLTYQTESLISYNKDKDKNNESLNIEIFKKDNKKINKKKSIIISIITLIILITSIIVPLYIIKYINDNEFQFKLYQYNQFIEEGNKDYRLGLYDDALESFKKALEISKSLKNNQYQLDSYQLIFNSVYSSGNYNEAFLVAEDYLKVEPKSLKVELVYHQMRGKIYFNIGKLEPCINERILSIELIKQLYQNNSNEEAFGEVQIGACYAEHGKYENAIQYYTIGFNIYQQMNDTYRDKYYYGFSLFHLGYSYFHSENLTNYMQESFKYFNSSYQIGLELYHQDSNKYYLFLTDRQNYLGRWYIKKGDSSSLDLGFQICKASESVLRDKSQFKIPEMAETLYLLGQIDRLRLNYNNALFYQTDSLNIRIEFYTPSGNLLRPNIAENYLEIGQDQVKLNNCTGAIYSMKKAKQIYDIFETDQLIKEQLLIINNTIQYCQKLNQINILN